MYFKTLVTKSSRTLKNVKYNFNASYRKMTSETPVWLTKLLEEQNFLKYHAYYKNSRNNHTAHGAIAIQRLGGDESRVKRYYDVMNQHMLKYNPNEELKESSEVDLIKSDSLLDYRGKNQAFYKMYKAYQEILEKKYNGNIKEMIRDVSRTIIDGSSVGLFHDVIQLGYGFVGNEKYTMLEGLVWMDQNYSPMCMNDQDNPKRTDVSKFGRGQTDFFDTLKKLRENKDLQEKMKEEKSIENGILVVAPKYHGDYFLDLTDDLKLPDSFNPDNKDPKQLKVLLDWCIDMAVVLYVSVETVNDFLLLHGITSRWCFKKMVPLLDYDTAILGIRAALATILAYYVVVAVPELTHKPEDYFSGSPSKEAWDELIKTTLYGKDYETHIYKVIQCLYDEWLERPDSKYAKYYISGAYMAQKHHYGAWGVPGAILLRNDDPSE